MIIVTRDPLQEHKESSVCWRVIKLYLLYVLYKGLLLDWFNPKHVAKTSEVESKLCFDWWFIFFVNEGIKLFNSKVNETASCFQESWQLIG